MSSTDATALAVARGQPLRQVMGYQSKWPYNLVAQPQYTRPEDLKGADPEHNATQLRAVLDGAKAMAMTVVDLWLRPDAMAQVREGFAADAAVRDGSGREP